MQHFPRVGVIGGGQLGRMLLESGQRYNIEFSIVDADAYCPAHHLANNHIVGSITENAPLHALAAITDVLTYEIEHIAIEALFELEKAGKTLIPAPSILRMVQHKGLQKQFYKTHGIATSDFEIVHNPQEWASVMDNKHWDICVAKSATGGYDGKGVQIVTSEEVAGNKIPFEGETVLEAYINNAKELSVIVARDKKGNLTTWPVVEMEFDPKANLVKYLFSPADISTSIVKEANDMAIAVVEAIKGVGIFAVEMFLDMQGKLWVNEMAPRPHNSGHHTIEACYTSQYEQLIRILTGLPLGSTAQLKPAAMVNILGANNVNGPYYLDNWDKLTAIPGVYVHLYGKASSKPMRKLGHVTILGDTLEEVKHKAILVGEWAIIKES